MGKELWYCRVLHVDGNLLRLWIARCYCDEQLPTTHRFFVHVLYEIYAYCQRECVEEQIPEDLVEHHHNSTNASQFIEKVTVLRWSGVNERLDNYANNDVEELQAEYEVTVTDPKYISLNAVPSEVFGCCQFESSAYCEEDTKQLQYGNHYHPSALQPVDVFLFHSEPHQKAWKEIISLGQDKDGIDRESVSALLDVMQALIESDESEIARNYKMITYAHKNGGDRRLLDLQAMDVVAMRYHGIHRAVKMIANAARNDTYDFMDDETLVGDARKEQLLGIVESEDFTRLQSLLKRTMVESILKAEESTSTSTLRDVKWIQDIVANRDQYRSFKTNKEIIDLLDKCME